MWRVQSCGLVTPYRALPRNALIGRRLPLLTSSPVTRRVCITPPCAVPHIPVSAMLHQAREQHVCVARGCDRASHCVCGVVVSVCAASGPQLRSPHLQDQPHAGGEGQEASEPYRGADDCQGPQDDARARPAGPQRTVTGLLDESVHCWTSPLFCRAMSRRWIRGIWDGC